MYSPAHIQKASDSGTSRVRKRPVIQADLEAGKPGDKYEQEADAVAQRVMMQPSMDEEEAVQMQPAEDKEETVQMQPAEYKEEAVLMQTVEEEEIAQMAAVDEDEVVQMQAAEEESVQMEMAVEEEEMTQMQSVGEEEEMVAMESITEEDESLQMVSAEEVTGALQMLAEEEEVIQQSPAPVLKRDGSGGTKTSSDLASRIDSAKGGGDSLESGIQREMEHKIGADFSGVNIHTGSSSVQMSRELGAKAFTVGNDIHFNRGQYDPHSSKGKRLLAHELTHTLQQGEDVNRIQKIDETNDENTPSHEYNDPEKGSINTINKKIEIPNIPVPTFKARFGPASEIKRPAGGFPRENDHLSDWADATSWVDEAKSESTGLVNRLNEFADSQNAPTLEFNEERIYYLTLKNDSNPSGPGVVFGNLDSVIERTSRPNWDEDGKYVPHHVDHQQEIQLGGDENDPGNMWMLEARANISSGSVIKNSRKNRVENLLTAAGPHIENLPTKYKDVQNEYEIIAKEGVVADPGLEVTGNPDQNYDLSDIQAGNQLNGLDFLNEEQIAKAGLRGSPNELILFTSQTGGKPIKIPWDEEAKSAGKKDGLSDLNIGIGKRGGTNLRVDSVHYKSSTGGNEGEGGTGAIICTAFPDSDGMIQERTLAFSIQQKPGISYGGVISRPSVLQAALHAMELRYLSPISMNTAELDDEVGLKGYGTVSPSVPLISDAEIELIIDENGARFRKVFSKNDFSFPSPFEVKESDLEVFAGTQGLGIAGEIKFEIDQVGEGNIGAGASTSGGFELEGEFNFDSKLFDPAKIGVEYKDETWTIGGEIGIPSGKVTGIKKATIKASYSEDTFKADGEAELDVPGIEKGTMNVMFGKEGFSIGGAFDLSSDIPGIRSGSVEATVSKKQGEEEYSVTATGKAKPEIPGVNTELSVGYDNGLITIGGTADYNRGMLSGSVRVGATNRPIGDDGQPEGEPDKTMRVYGGGSLTLQLTPWLEATAGVEFLENGEMEVKGKIGLPSTVDVFPRKEIKKDIFRAPTLEIPLFAIPLGPRSIGLVAQIGGGLSFKAGFGPGQLRELYAEVTYNPDKEEETELSGRGKFAIPADAGLTLSADASLGVSAGIGSLTGGIELAGTLGLKGEAAAEVDVNWSPQTGIALDAKGSVTVHPKFKFDVNAFARGSLGAGFLKVSKTWRHNLAGFEWGPDIQFGIIFPVKYREGEPFDLSFDDIEVIYPELDIPKMAKGLARDVKDDMF